MKCKRSIIDKIILRKKLEVSYYSDFKTVQYWHKARQIDSQKITGSPVTDTQVHIVTQFMTQWQCGRDLIALSRKWG